MTNTTIRIASTEQQKAAAFEWLRQIALDTEMIGPKSSMLAAIALQEWHDLKTAGWIPVTERLPDHDGPCIVCIKPLLEERRIVKLSMYVKPAHPSFNGFHDAPVTHWQPFPTAPIG